MEASLSGEEMQHVLSRFCFQLGLLYFSVPVPGNVRAYSLQTWRLVLWKLFATIPNAPLESFLDLQLYLQQQIANMDDVADIPTGVILSGAEHQRLRTFCTSQVWTAKDLDYFGRLLQSAPLEIVRADFHWRIKNVGLDRARQSLLDIAYGPTKIPLYNYILQLTHYNPPRRLIYLQILFFLAFEAKIPVDSSDLSGNTTLMYSICTKPYFDIEVAEIMLYAGGDINRRNRYGCVAGHDIVMARVLTPTGKKRTLDALKYFMQKGGDINIADGDGITVKYIGTRLRPRFPELAMLVNGEPLEAISMPNTASGKKLGRNDICSCGSKKKYKACCGKVGARNGRGT